MNNSILSDIITSVENLRHAMVDSNTRSRFVSDGIYSMFVVLIPDPDDGGLVVCIEVDEIFCFGSVTSYNHYDDYDLAVHEYERIDL